MHHGLLYSTIVLCASNLGLQCLGFIYRIGVSRLAGAQGLGIYHLAYSVYAVINAACLSGVTTACSRTSAELKASGYRGAIGFMTKKAAKIFIIFLTVSSVILFFWRDFIAYNILGDLRIKFVFPIMIICLALTGVENIVKSICIGIDKVECAATSELTEQIVRIVSVLWLLYIFRNNINACILIFIGMSISEFVSAFMLYKIYKSKIKVEPLAQRNLPNNFSHEFMKIILPLTGAAVLNNLLGSASSFILPKRLMIAGLTEEQALYEIGVISGMAMPLLLMPMALIGSLCTVIMPAISKSKASGNKERINSLTKKAIDVTGLIAIPLTALVVPLAPTLSRLFFAQPLSLEYVFILGIEVILIYYQMVTSGILNGLGKQKFIVFSAVTGEILQLLFVWVLVANPNFGIYGYIIAQIIASFFTVICNFVCICSVTNLGKNLFYLLSNALICGSVVFLWVRIIYTFFLGVVGFQWLSVICTMFSSGIICLILLRMLGVKLNDYIKTGKSNLTAFIWSVY